MHVATDADAHGDVDVTVNDSDKDNVNTHRSGPVGMSEGAMVPCAKATWIREVGPRTCLM